MVLILDRCWYPIGKNCANVVQSMRDFITIVKQDVNRVTLFRNARNLSSVVVVVRPTSDYAIKNYSKETMNIIRSNL